MEITIIGVIREELSLQGKVKLIFLINNYEGAWIKKNVHG